METLFTILILVTVFAFAIYLKLNQAKIRGRLGETKVSLILNSLPEGYYVFNDIYLRQGDISVQIDHIVISVYGVFVIETKNYTGWIYGSDQSEQWVKNMYGHKYHFQNPLRQNYSHVKRLQNIFGLSTDKFIPIVVFLSGATLKCHTQGIVIYSSQLKSLMGSYTTPILDLLEVRKLADILLSLNISDKRDRKLHIDNVRRRIYQTRDSINSGVCPKCGGRLVKRQGLYGQFLGCSNYPRCKFTLRD